MRVQDRSGTVHINTQCLCELCVFSLADGRGAELLEYRWLRLEDGTSNQPIMVKLFSTSQPESHQKLLPRETHTHAHTHTYTRTRTHTHTHTQLTVFLCLSPVSVVVCSRLKLIRSADRTDASFYLTNTTHTQVYCTGNSARQSPHCDTSGFNLSDC